MFYQKLSDTAFSGEAPQTDDDFKFLQSLGVQYILNLEMGYIEFFFREKRNHEVMGAMDHGMKGVHIMMSDFFAPSFAELDHSLEIVKTYGVVYFHCRRGKDRTGMVRAAYRVLVQGWDVEKAIKEMVDLGHSTFPYFWWRNHLRAYIKARQK